MTSSTIDTLGVSHREPFSGGSQAYSGATFERAVTAGGRPVLLKHLPAGGDWLVRATDGLGRARRLWESGLLGQVGGTVEHAVIDLWREDGHDVVVMNDMSDVLLPPDTRLSRSEVERLLAGLAGLHAAFEGRALDGLCSPAGRHRLFVPAFQRDDHGPNPCPVRDFVIAGWEMFVGLWPADVVDAVFALHDDPGLLQRQLELAAPPTLLHGDTKLDNLGLRGERLVAVDWGELTGTGPAEMDLAWFAATGTGVMPGAPTWRIDARPDEVFAVYEAHAARPLDRRALDLACLGMITQMGWYLTGVLGDDVARARTEQLEPWWLARARAALEPWSPA